jgi:glycosyltransferase involved in cell wall biosynthesis
MDRVVIDLERLKYPFGGMGQFCKHFGNSILENAADFEIEAVPLTRPSSLECIIPPERYVAANWWRKEFVARYLNWLPAWHEPDIALWHATHHQTKFWPEHKNIPVLLTIHDLKFLQLCSEAEIVRKLRSLQKVIDRVAGIVTISQSVKQDITSHLDLKGKTVHVIYNGVYPSGSIEAQRPATIKSKPFLFSIGLFERKKNFHTLVEMMEHLPEYHLVLAGDHHSNYGRFVRSRVELRSFRDRIHFLGTITDSERQWLYENCTAFVFPSLAEGFGLPVLEAMSAGRPVILSNHTSLPEVGGDVAQYWTNFEPEYMAHIVKDCLARFQRDAVMPMRMIQRASCFSWTKAAREYLALYRNMIEAGKTMPRIHHAA